MKSPNTAPVMIAYELHIRQRGDWKIDSIFDDRELALFEARRADHTDRYTAIRVVEETYDEETGRTASRVIFRSSQADKEARTRRAAAGSKPSPPRRPAGPGKNPAKRSKRRIERKEQSVLFTVLVVVFVFATGFAGLVALSQMAR